MLEKSIKKKQESAEKNYEDNLKIGLQTKFRTTAIERLDRAKQLSVKEKRASLQNSMRSMKQEIKFAESIQQIKMNFISKKAEEAKANNEQDFLRGLSAR